MLHVSSVPATSVFGCSVRWRSALMFRFRVVMVICRLVVIKSLSTKFCLWEVTGVPSELFGMYALLLPPRGARALLRGLFPVSLQVDTELL
jgi:hypothetical protein